MKKNFTALAIVLLFVLSIFANEREIVLGHTNLGNGHNQIYVDPPRVTYDEELNELTVYFGSTGTVDIEYVDTLGTPYCYVQGESHSSNSSTTYTGLPAGYYTITIHSIYGYTYTGNFTVM